MVSRFVCHHKRKQTLLFYPLARRSRSVLNNSRFPAKNSLLSRFSSAASRDKTRGRRRPMKTRGHFPFAARVWWWRLGRLCSLLDYGLLCRTQETRSDAQTRGYALAKTKTRGQEQTKIIYSIFFYSLIRFNQVFFVLKTRRKLLKGNVVRLWYKYWAVCVYCFSVVIFVVFEAKNWVKQ